MRSTPHSKTKRKREPRLQRVRRTKRKPFPLASMGVFPSKNRQSNRQLAYLLRLDRYGRKLLITCTSLREVNNKRKIIIGLYFLGDIRMAMQKRTRLRNPAILVQLPPDRLPQHSHFLMLNPNVPLRHGSPRTSGTDQQFAFRSTANPNQPLASLVSHVSTVLIVYITFASYNHNS